MRAGESAPSAVIPAQAGIQNHNGVRGRLVQARPGSPPPCGEEMEVGV